MKTQNSPLSKLEFSATHSRLQARKPIRLIARIAAVCILLFAGVAVSRAASGVWTNDASSVWSATTNWLNGAVADGSGNIADFTMNNSNVDTVTMDASHSLGLLLFGNNAGTTTNNWILNASGGSALTLAGGTPTISVSNGFTANNIVAALPLAGTAGLTKAGNGTLVLAGNNTYTGTTTVSGGTLQLTNTLAGVSTTDPVLYYSFDNVVGNTVINQGTGGSPMNGLLVGSATIVPGGKYGKALSIPAGAATASLSYVLVNNAVVPLNVSAPGNNWTVAMWIQTSTAGAAYFYQGSGGWGNANTEFYLENGTAGDGAGGHAGGVRFAQGWESGTANINDGNWHFVVMTCTNAVKTIYVDGAVDPFIAGVNQWGGVGAGNQVRIGGAAAGADSQIGLGGLIDEFYMYNRALSAAEVTTLMNTSSGPTDVAASLPATGTVSVTAPGTLDMNASIAYIGGLTGIGTVDNRSGSPTLMVNPVSNVEYDGLIKNTSGALSLTMLGTNTLTLGGTNANTGVTVVSGGTLNVTGAFEPNPPTANTGGITVANAAGNAVVNFTGSFLTNYNYNIGAANGAVGALYLTGTGHLAASQGANGANFQIGSVPGSYGYYYIGAGASMDCNEIGVAGEGQPSGFGIMDVSGGTVNDTGYLVMSRGTTGAEIGVLNVYSGLLKIGTVNGAGLQCNWGTAGISVVNVLGGTVSVTGNLTINLNNTGNAGNTGILNLNGGIAQCGWVSGGANGTRVNFNGGTLQSDENQTVMMQGLAAANVYSGGGTINNNGFNITVGQQLVAPAGNGVNGISGFTPGAGYIEPPIVTVVRNASDTTGIGATAIAQIDSSTGGATSGQVTNIVITCPGVNYTATPTFTLTGGGATTPATITGAAPTANVSGGITFTGSGTTLLTGGYSYTGPTFLGGGIMNLVSTNLAPSVPGALIVSNATLNVNASSGIPLAVGGFALKSNAVVNLTLTTTNNGINASGNLTFETNATLNLNFGNVSANPANPAINASGSISVGPTNFININAFGLKGGSFPVIKYTGAQLTSGQFANIGLGLPPGVTANLVNNPGEIDLNVVSAPNSLSWNGVNGTSWDTTTANWTNSANGTITTYQEHNNGISIAGDTVTFDDTLTNSTPQPTNVNLTAAFHPFPINVNSTLPYSIGGAGGLIGSSGNTGIPYLTKNNTGSLTLTTSNGFTGGFSILGGQVVITNDFSLGANNGLVTLNGGSLQINNGTTNTARPFSLTGASTIGVSSNAVARYGGVFSGTGGLTKAGFGTLTLAGANTYLANTFVNQGTLVVDSGGAINTPSYSSIGQVGSDFGTLILMGTGSFKEGNDFNLGDSGNSIGTLNIQDTATLTVNSIYVGSANAASSATIGTVNQIGGTVTQTNTTAGDFTIGGRNAATAGAIGIYNLSGGTVNASSSVRVGGYGRGTVNQSGGTFNATAGGINLERLGGFGTYNLNGGTLVTLNVNTSSNLNPSTFNFNGGTLKAAANSSAATFFQGLTAAYIYNGGATIDDGGFGITIAQALQQPGGAGAPPNSGISSIPLANGGSGYISPPIVTIVDDSQYGSNATAVAQIDPVSGTVTGLTVTSPGSGWDPAFSFVDVTFTGGGINPISPTIGTPTFAVNGTGGLTKQGSGTVTLTGVNTFTGPITNNAGTLALNSASTYAGAVQVNAGTVSMTTASTLTGSTTITNGAGLTIVQLGSAQASISNLTVGVSTTAANGATLGLGLTGQNPTAPLVNCGTLTFNGTNTISLSGAVKVGPIPLVHYFGALAAPGITNVNLTLPQGVVGSLSNSAANSTVYAIITSPGPGLVWSGTNSVAALTNLWDINSTTNWLLGSTSTSYHQPIIPGDAVTFNDSGSGTVILNTNVGPASLVISNNSKSYIFKGTGTISGPGGITMLGSGTAILNLTNAYTGDTVISNGTLQVGSATAISPTANLNVGSGGTLELAGLSETVNTLNGSGTIDNNSAIVSSTLTFGNGGGSTWNGTIHDQGLGFGVSLTKVGNNQFVINGGTNLLRGANPGIQMNAGITIVSNNAVVDTGANEYWIQQNAGIATNILDGGTLNVGNYFVVGRNAGNAVGTFIMNSGTVNKAGGGVVVVGSLGAVGTLVINGGTFLNNSDLWLGEGPSAVTALYLNGGLIQADVIRENNNGGLPTANQYAYFNGGTLQATANNANYLQQVNFEVMGGGLVLDDNGYTLSIGAPTVLLAGDGLNGGLFKKGSGILYLDTPNQYTGLTVVTNGTLAGVGSVNGPVLVTPAGNLGAGDAGATVGTFTINNNANLTLQGNATMRISKTGGTKTQDNVVVSGNISYGGTLTVNNVTSDSTPLAAGDTFQLFTVTGSVTGNFTSVAGFGATYSFNPNTGILTVVSTGPGVFTNPTGISSFKLNGANVVITATNGQAGGAYYLLESTNVALKLNQWTTVATNVVSANGNYTFTGTNVVTAGGNQQFYILSNTNYNH